MSQDRDAAPAPAPENLHASTVVIGETGILIRGPSGAGKTRLALALVETARRDGRFARLVADDRTMVSAHGAWRIARPHPALAGLVERRGLGILPVEHEPAGVLGLVVDLTPEPVARLPAGRDETEIGGASLPRLAVPIGTGTGDATSLVLARLATLDAS